MYFGYCQRCGKGPVPQLAGMLANHLCFRLNRKETQLDILYNHVKEVFRFEGKLDTFFSTNHVTVFLTLQKKGTIKTCGQFSLLHFTISPPHRLQIHSNLSCLRRSTLPSASVHNQSWRSPVCEAGVSKTQEQIATQVWLIVYGRSNCKSDACMERKCRVQGEWEL